MIDLSRPPISDEKRKELERYLLDHWQRALLARQPLDQPGGAWERWDKNYRGVPREATRTIPWPNASNIVVSLIRIFLDTFASRTLNLIFATRPLYTIEGFPREAKEALEDYLNRKALHVWDHYTLARDLIHRGAKNGTAVVKVIWEERSVWTSNEDLVTYYQGPRGYVLPIRDFYVYPAYVDTLRDVTIKFHKVRKVEEEAVRAVREGDWVLTEEELKQALEVPADVDRQALEKDGVVDTYLREVQVVECYLDWPITNDSSRYYSIVAVICPAINKLIDLYYNPYPPQVPIFLEYKPYPQEGFWYGESLCEILGALQEEASVIHNDRRNNSYLANAPMFKRKSGSLIPNPSTSWYPGKVWDVEEMDDFEPLVVGQIYNSMLDQEAYLFQLAERLSGIGALMQGYAAGMMGKRGIYNAAGTLAIMQESNQRQDTNIRDVREVLGSVGKTHFLLQAQFGPDDPFLEQLSPDAKEQVTAVLRTPLTSLLHSRFEVKASTAGINREFERQSLFQMLSVLNQYGGLAVQLGTHLANQQLNPVLRIVMGDTLRMMKWMATRLLRAFDLWEAEGVLPDVHTALERFSGGAQTPPGPLSRAGLEGLTEALTGLEGAYRGAGVGLPR